MAVDVAKLAIQLEAQGAEAVIGQLEGIGGVAKGLASAVAAGALAFEGLEKSMEFLKESIGAATEEDQVFARMGIAVTNAGVSFAQARPAIEALLHNLSDHSTFRVDELGLAFTRLVQLTGNVGGSMKMLGIVTDFAAGRNIDLETSANLVGKAMNGNATQLNRQLGLHGSAAQALEVLTERYHGNAQALADVSPQTLASNAMHELEEEIGHVIKNEGELDKSTLSWRDVLQEATKWVHEHRTEIGALVKDFIKFVEFTGGTVMLTLAALAKTWEALHLGLLVGIATVKDIGPAWDLMVSHIVAGEVALLQAITTLIPGLHAVLDGIIQKFNSYAVTLSNDATVALAKNRQEMDAYVNSIKVQTEETEKAIQPVKEKAKAHAENTKALFQESEALTKLAELHKLSGPEFVQLEADYTKLTALVAKHTLSLEDEAKAEELLAKMRKAAPVLSGPSTVFEPLVSGKAKQTVDQGLAIYEKAIVDGLKKSEAADKAALKHKAEMFAASSQGQFFLATEKIKEELAAKVKNDFLNLSVDLAGTIADTLSAAFTGGFKAAGKAALAGLGNILSSMGKQMIVSGLALVGLLPALSNPFTSGAAMITAGVILSAAGAILGGIATGSGGGGGGGGGGSSYAAAGTASKAAQITNITVSSAGASGTRKLAPMQPVAVTIIGPNDGKAQRDLFELLNNGHARGMRLGT